MPRRRSDYTTVWKISLAATTAAKVEHLLLDNLTGRPIYATRSQLVQALVERWLAEQLKVSTEDLPPVPTIEQLRLT